MSAENNKANSGGKKRYAFPSLAPKGPKTIKLTDEEMANWATLLEAVDSIADVCEAKGIDFYNERFQIKPHAIEKFVRQRSDFWITKLKELKKQEETPYHNRFLI